MTRRSYDSRTVELVVDTADAMVRDIMVDLAEKELATAYAEANPSGHHTFVNGVKGAQPQSVRPPRGSILFQFYYTSHIVADLLKILAETSPVDSGEYRDHHTAFLAGSPVIDLSTLNIAQRVVVANTTPYARVVERGLHGRVPWSKQPQVPAEGVYKSAVKKIKNTWGKAANISRTWVEIDGTDGRVPAIIIERRL